VDVLTALPPGLLDGLGFLGLATLVIVLIVRGHLVPGNVHDKALADKDAQITKAWEVAAAEGARADVLQEQNAALINGSRTALDVIEALRKVAESRGEPDGA
jgi:hypothetical protein